MNRIAISTILLVAIRLATPILASATPITTVPPGLHNGDQYRLVFVTDGSYSGKSTNISFSNKAVVSAASEAPALVALGTTWSAIASTAIDAAYDNTSTHPGIDPDYPIYNLNGELVAANNAELWSGQLLNAIRYTQSGAIQTNKVLAGTAINGLPSEVPLNGGNAKATFALPGAVDSTWIYTPPPAISFGPYYAISGVLTVVPEPGTIGLASVGAASIAVVFVLRSGRNSSLLGAIRRRSGDSVHFRRLGMRSRKVTPGDLASLP